MNNPKKLSKVRRDYKENELITLLFNQFFFQTVWRGETKHCLKVTNDSSIVQYKTSWFPVQNKLTGTEYLCVLGTQNFVWEPSYWLLRHLKQLSTWTWSKYTTKGCLHNKIQYFLNIKRNKSKTGWNWDSAQHPCNWGLDNCNQIWLNG